MMKKISALLFLIICAPALCSAQGSREAIQQDPGKTAGQFYIYDPAELPAMTPAPKGYKPFYISHFARHGARYCIGDYDSMHGWLSKASEAGVLTEAGKHLFEIYEPYYEQVKFCKGNLTAAGQNQHRGIASRMYGRFPEVFKGATRVEAASTESPRVIMSMWSCLSRLDELDKDIDINADASAKFAPWLQTGLASNPYLVKDRRNTGQEIKDVLKDYFNETVPWEEIILRFFTSLDVPSETMKTSAESFIRSLHNIISANSYLGINESLFDGMLSEEESYLIWKTSSASYFSSSANLAGSKSLVVDYAGFTLSQIIESADADIASDGTQLRLRFGHDSGLMPLFVFMDLNGSGRTAATLEESLDIFPNYNIPMGSSMQLVFFRKAGAPVLVKALLNEQEATLPLEPVSGPYYKWDDFKAHFLPLIAASKAKIDSFRSPSNQ